MDAAVAMTMPTSAAEGRQHHRLDQELQQHLALQRADGQAQADLAGPFGDADQHDVHDADAADQQAHRGHRAEQRGHHLRGAGQRLGELLGVEHVEVVVVGRRELAPLAQQLASGSPSARVLSLPSCIDTSSVATRWLPVTRRCSVCSGTSTVSSWSLPIAAWPLEASTPITSQENCLMRSCSPRPPGRPCRRTARAAPSRR